MAKRTIDLTGRKGFAYNLDTIVPGRHNTLEAVRAVESFKETAKQVGVSIKRRSHLTAINEFIGLYRPKQYFATWYRASDYCDDSIIFYYTPSSETLA